MAEQYESVAALLADPKRWTKGTMARDERGECTLPHDPHVACWCVLGAIHRVYGGDRKELVAARGRLERLVLVSGVPSIGAWNDAANRTHQQVICACQLAGI